MKRRAVEIASKYVETSSPDHPRLVNDIFKALKKYQKAAKYDDSDEFERGFVFVIMPFNDEGMQGVYDAICEECDNLKLHAERADEDSSSSPIMSDIIKSIEEAEFIICDLTDARPNVYYELGFAHGIGNRDDEILLIAKSDVVVHFDVGHRRVHRYRTVHELRRIIRDRFSEMVAEAREH
jgi:hypothetical protein